MRGLSPRVDSNPAEVEDFSHLEQSCIPQDIYQPNILNLKCLWMIRQKWANQASRNYFNPVSETKTKLDRTYSVQDCSSRILVLQ